MSGVLPVRRLRAAARAVALLAALAAPPAPALVAVVQAVDDAGVTVTLPAPARRIVSLAPHATELLFAAGAGDRIVGAVETSDWPPAARALPRVGDSRAIDLERIVALQPDLVVTWPYTAPAQVERLRARGIPVFTTDPKTVEGIAADLERLGTLVGREARTRELVAAMTRRVAELRRASAGKRTLTVFYEIWPAPLYTVGGGHLISQALGICGGANVFAASTLPAPVVGTEAVLAAKPEVIIAAADDGLRPDWLDEWRRWPALPAVAAGNLYAVDGNLLHRAGPRFVDGVEALCRVLDAARRGPVDK
jgi:iron complex transport system substrate-binding protein